MAQTTTTLWQSLWATPNVKKVYGCDINGEWYGPDNEVSHSVDHELYSEFGIGNATSATLRLTIFADDIPKGTTIKRYVQLQSGDQTSEWLPKGVFFTNRRSEEDGLWEVEAVDAMRRADQIWEPAEGLEFPLTMPQAVEAIAAAMGVEVDPRTVLKDYSVDYPVDYTMRQVLKFIAAANCGNFIITGEGKLFLVPLLSAPEFDDYSYLVTEDGARITLGGVAIVL